MTVAEITGFPGDRSPAPAAVAAIVLIVTLSAEPIACERAYPALVYTLHAHIGLVHRLMIFPCGRKDRKRHGSTCTACAADGGRASTVVQRLVTTLTRRAGPSGDASTGKKPNISQSRS